MFEEKNTIAGATDVAEPVVQTAQEPKTEDKVDKVDNKVGKAEINEITSVLNGGRWFPKKPWPENCPWPQPTEDGCEYDEDYALGIHDEATDELMAIKEYFDSLVEIGRLNEDYSLNEDYEPDYELDDHSEIDNDVDAHSVGNDADWDDDDFYDSMPEMAQDYWDDGFDIESWREDLSHHINLLRIAPMCIPMDPHKDPVGKIQSLLHYHFTNENLLRQAFTRRAFAIEYGLSGCSEELEFLGDSMLSTVVTKELFAQFAENTDFCVDAPFQSDYNEGELTKLRSQFISKEALSARARELGLGDFILYGTGETETDSSLEDMMEALIGAVVVDSDWNMKVIEEFVNKLIVIQFECVDYFLQKSYYDIVNAWHQKHFGVMPEYKVYKRVPGTGICKDRGFDHGFPYICEIEFQVPENDKGVNTHQIIEYDGETRSIAREHTAECAYNFIVEKGLWKNLAEAKIVPDYDNSINQLQELYQKKYIEEAPEYEYEDLGSQGSKGSKGSKGYKGTSEAWRVTCDVESFRGWGTAESKAKAKKKAAYMVLVKMLTSAGICETEWRNEMYRMM